MARGRPGVGGPPLRLRGDPMMPVARRFEPDGRNRDHRRRPGGRSPARRTGWGVFFIVDGMNVIGSEPDGWWRDRPAARRRLVELLVPLRRAGHDVTVVFDGRARAGEDDEARSAGVRISFAPGGPNAADDAIVEMVGALSDPAHTTVVTSDRGLVGRVLALGASVESATAFRARLSGVPDPT